MQGETERAVVVRTAGLRWGLWLRHVVELLPMVAVTPLPAAPAVVEGVVDVRGNVAPVLPLRRRVGLPEAPPGPSDRLVLVRTGERRLALRVDALEDIVDIDHDQVDEAVSSDDRYTLGVARLDDGLLLLVDLDAFLSSDEAIELDLALAWQGHP